MPELGEWNSFYVIIGSAAGALIGLQFVVLTIIADRPHARVAAAAAAFATPTIVHFSAVFFLSAVLLAPWHGIGPAAGLWGLGALLGIAYTGMVVRRMRLQTAYQPEFEDWCFHAILPFAAYGGLAFSAVAARGRPREALFGVGAASLLLLFVGIHNAWDTVFYHVLVRKAD